MEVQALEAKYAARFRPLLDRVCLYMHTHTYLTCIHKHIFTTYCLVMYMLVLLQRRDIVMGSYEPTDKECEWKDEDEDDEDDDKDDSKDDSKKDGDSAVSGLAVSATE